MQRAKLQRPRFLSHRVGDYDLPPSPPSPEISFVKLVFDDLEDLELPISEKLEEDLAYLSTLSDDKTTVRSRGERFAVCFAKKEPKRVRANSEGHLKPTLIVSFAGKF